jgi:hypothetical protein
MAPVIGGLPGQKAETASQLIQQYVDWIISQTPLTAQQKPATAGFMLTQNNPASFGKEPTTSQPEVVYSQGVLAYSGFGTLWGYGTIQSNQNLFNVARDMVYVSLETNGVLTVNGGPSWSLTLHHDVLVGSTFMPVESTSPGTVVTLMLWGIPGTRVA